MLNVGSLILQFLIVKALSLKREVFTLAALLFMFNPIIFHWTIKSAPEPLVTFLLLLWCYLILMGRRFWPLAAIVFFISFFVRPTFLFVPITFGLAGIVLKRKAVLLFSLGLLVLGFAGYRLNNKLTVQPHMDELTTYSSGLHEIIMDAYFVDNVVATKRFHTGSLDWPDGNRPMAHSQYWNWLEENRQANDNRFSLIFKFVKEHPKMTAQKFVLNPMFFFCTSSTVLETWIILGSSALLVALMILALVKQRLEGDYLILMIMLGYCAIFWVGHSYSRYFFVLLPFVCMFAARGIMISLQLLKNGSRSV